MRAHIEFIAWKQFCMSTMWNMFTLSLLRERTKYLICIQSMSTILLFEK